MSTTTRPIPTRQDSEVNGTEDAPPPAYEAVPSTSTSGEVTLDRGPSRPFQPVTQPPIQQQHSYNNQQQSQAPSHLPPPIFPFWNGASLSPQQTGFNPNQQQQQYGHPYQQYQSYSPQPQSQFSSHPPPPHHPSSQVQYQQSIPSQQSQQQYSPPPSHPSSTSTTTSTSTAKPKYSPTSIATPGQPFLNKGKLLVFPPNKPPCPKCSDTGYKFNDPSHPCRKCWDKFGKLFTPVILFAPDSNLQKPLRSFATPSNSSRFSSNGYPGSYSNSQSQGGYHQPIMNMSAQPLVVHPGDPRIGGALCNACGGDGLVDGGGFSFFGDSTETCRYCRGSGRVFH